MEGLLPDRFSSDDKRRGRLAENADIFSGVLMQCMQVLDLHI
jgi:hypothetical protein